MSVTNQNNKVSYLASAGQTAFPVPFYFADNSHIKLYVDDVLLTSGYTLSGAGAVLGGSLTFSAAPGVDKRVVILRDIPLNQPNSFSEGGPFQAKVLESMFDRLTYIDQQIDEKVNRAIKFPVSSNVNTQMTGVVVPRGMLVFNSAGTALEVGPNVDTFKSSVEASAAAAATSASNSATSATAAGSSATAAATSASSAGVSATAAATSATNAATSASQAATSASSATGQANQAATSAANAAISATQASDSATSAGVASTSANAAASAANTSATNAAASASQAATSATAAGTSATNAANSASSAGTSASSASTSATNAANSASSAGTSATNAANSATAAAASATQASTSASQASTSATNAANSATAANNSATSAATSATNANTSATNAASSATSAGTSATNASASATSAANSATAAANSATSAANSATAAAASAASLSSVVVNATTGNETDKAPSVAAMKSYVTANSGGGGGSLSWEKLGDLSPINNSQDGIKLEGFGSLDTQEIYLTVNVPSNYNPGTQIRLLEGAFFVNANSGNVRFRTQTALLSAGSTVLGTYSNIHTSTNASVAAPATLNQMRSIGTIDLSDATGKINGVSVAGGDKLRVRLYRDLANEGTSANGMANLMINNFSISFN